MQALPLLPEVGRRGWALALGPLRRAPPLVIRSLAACPSGAVNHAWSGYSSAVLAAVSPARVQRQVKPAVALLPASPFVFLLTRGRFVLLLKSHLCCHLCWLPHGRCWAQCSQLLGDTDPGQTSVGNPARKRGSVARDLLFCGERELYLANLYFNLNINSFQNF